MSSPQDRRRGWLLARLAALALLAGFIGLLAFGLARQAPDDTIAAALSRGDTAPAPAFTLPVLQAGGGTPAPVRAALADGTLSLMELSAHGIVLNFWASWCPPCREETPLLQASWRRRPAGIVYLGLDMWDVDGDAKDFLREFDVSYPVVRDSGDAVARRYGVTGLPETFFIAPRSKVVGRVIGSLSARQLRAGLRAIHTGRPLGALEGGDRRSAE